MEPIHVRQIISSMHYKTLVECDIIPHILKDVELNVNRKYLPWVYSGSKTNPNIFSELGLFMEELIINALSPALSPMLSDYTGDNAYDMTADYYKKCWLSVSSNNECPIGVTSAATINYWKKIVRVLMDTRPIGSNILHCHEMVVKSVQGHPDIIDMDSYDIIDVKVTTSFNTMKESAALQILSYAALARELGIPTKRIGLVLPMQGIWLMYDIRDWDHTKYFNRLVSESILFYQDRLALLPCYVKPWLEVGHHIAIADLHKLISINTVHNVAYQFFLTSPQSRSRVQESIKTMNLSSLRIYVHGPYIINLCHPIEDDKHVGINYFQYFRDLLVLARTIHTRGFVLHVGTHKVPRRGCRRMHRALRYLLQEASPECPLILETSAGEGNDLLTEPEQLIEYYGRFSRYHDRFKLCVDTCHVFAAGHDPLEFIVKVHSRFPNSLVLIHFNDSKFPRGSRKDRHAGCGTGYIGYNRMREVWSWAKAHGVDMVRE
jgi:deoxyribonuclease-4